MISEIVSSVLLPFALSYLANNVPGVKELVIKNKSLDARMKACYDRAVKHWPCEAFREFFGGKNYSHLDDLKDYVLGDINKLQNKEIQDLVGQWVLEMQKDGIYEEYLHEIKTDQIISSISINTELLSQVHNSIVKLETIPQKLDEVIHSTEKLGQQMGILKDEISKEIRQNHDQLSDPQEEDIDGFILLNQFFSGMKMGDCPKDIISDVEQLMSNLLWVDEERERIILETLDNRGMMLVKGMGGRGKSILCLRVGYRLYQEGYNVYITQKTWDWRTLKKSAYVIAESNKKSIIIMENAHLLSLSLFDLLEDLKGICNLQKEQSNSINTFFLLNLRPTFEGDSPLYPNTLDESYFLDLMIPEVQEARAAGLVNHLIEHYQLNPEELFVNHVPLKETAEYNLKTLSIYFSIYTDSYHRSNDITESQVLHVFTRNFHLHDATKTQFQALWLLGALGSFDAPADSFFMTEREVNALRKYRDQGLCYQVNSVFYLSHSTEAINLFKALCFLSYGHCPNNEELADLVTGIIISYFWRIVKKPLLLEGKRKDVEDDFVMPVLWSLHEDDGLDYLYGFFRDPEIANVVITKISPSYVIKALYKDDNDAESTSRLKIYVDNIDWIRDHLFDIGYNNLNMLFLVLKNNYKYNCKMIDDLFGDYDVLEAFVTEYQEKFLVARYSISKEINNRYEKLSKPIKMLDNQYRCDMSLRECMSRIKGLLGALLRNKIELDNAERIADTILEIVRSIVKENPGVCSSALLSRFITKITSIASSYRSLVAFDEVFQNDVLLRLKQPIITQGDMYLFGKFYNIDEIKTKIDSYFMTSSEMNRNTMYSWLEEVKKRTKEGLLITDSLADTVDKVLRSQ